MGAERILARADELGAISETDGSLRRAHLTEAHRRAADLVARWMREAGLEVREDAVGNVIGRLEGREPGLPALLLGSHIDTVPDAGRYDGPLGVLLAIEAVEAVIDCGEQRRDGDHRRSPSRGSAAQSTGGGGSAAQSTGGGGSAAQSTGGSDLPFAIEVVAFSDEEGTRFGTALSGSRALAGGWRDEWLDYRDADGTSYADALRAYGLDPSRVTDAAREPASVIGYLEVHIEQGPYLEEAGRPLAVVTSIAAARRFALTMTGRAGHAGGTPYERRRDALVGASELVVEIERIGRDSGVIATVGRLQAFPGGVNVIPGRVEFSLDLRAEHDADRDAAWRRIRDEAKAIAARRGLAFAAVEEYRADAVVCDAALREAVVAGIRAAGAPQPLELWSRAGHDAMAVAQLAPVAMLFVRNGNGGISHHPDEIVAETDVAAALEALVATVREVAARR